MFYTVLYRDLVFYSVNGFLKMENDPRSFIHGNLLLYFCVPEFWLLHLYKFSRVHEMNHLSNRMLAKVTSH